MKTTAIKPAPVPVLSLVSNQEESTARVLYGMNGYSRVKDIFSIRPVRPVINLLENFIHESERSDPNWFSSYE